VADFQFTVEGQPPSVNHAYHPGRTKDGRLFVRKASGIENYQLLVTSACRQAKPSSWHASPQVRIKYAYYLKRDIDCDNAKKFINDAIAIALGVNDRTFLSCDMLKVTGIAKPFVQIEVENVPSRSR